VHLRHWVFACSALFLAGLDRPAAQTALLRFDGESKGVLAAGSPVFAGDVTFTEGRIDRAVRFGKGRVVLALARALPRRGTIEYWVRTLWSDKKEKMRVSYFSMGRKQPDGATACLAAWASGDCYGWQKEMSVCLDEDLKHIRDRYFQRRLACSLWDLGSRDWYKVTISYDLAEPGKGRAALYVNEVLKDRLDGLALKTEALGTSLVLGATDNAQCFLLDDFTIWAEEKRYDQNRERNLLANPGFEEDDNHDGVPDGWQPLTGDKGAGYWGGPPDCKREDRGVSTWCADRFYSGKRSACMQGFHPAVGGQLISLGVRGFTPGETYEIDGAVCSFTPARLTPSIRVVPWDNNHECMKEHVLRLMLRVPKQNAGQWLSISEVARGRSLFTPPKGCRTITLYLHLTGKGKVLWDDLHFGRAGQP